MTPTPRRLDADELVALTEQRDFLLRSLADLEREHEAGDLEDEDFEALRDDYTARAAETLRAIEGQREVLGDQRPPRQLGRSLLVGAGVLLFAVLAGLLAANAMGARKAGESASGGISVQESTSQRANACSTKINTDPDGAFSCLQGVLDDDPTNAVALTWSAWQLSMSAPSFDEPERSQYQALAAVRLEQAVASDPNYSYAWAFRAVVAYRNGRFAEAQEYLDDFKARNPSAQAAEVIEGQQLQAKIDDALADAAEEPG